VTRKPEDAAGTQASIAPRTHSPNYHRRASTESEMAIHGEPTPNPNALKFIVGGHFPTPLSFVAGRPADHPAAAALLALPGVTSVFMTADFVTISKAPDAFWDEITPAARHILEEHFAG
jgi:hypothetical protein